MEEIYEIHHFTLDFTECTTIMEVYNVIRKGLELPDWVGSNPNALWDSLRGIMYTPAEITVNYKLGDAQLTKYIKMLIDIMYEAAEEFGDITVKLNV